MRKTLLLLLLVALAMSPRTASARTTTSFDAGWRFLKADAPGAEQPAFDDAAWRALDLPHDWSIEGPFDQNAPAGGAGAFLPTGVGWYRKTFTLPVADAHQHVFVDFDGVMANSDVWVNGFYLGRRPNGYVSFRDDLTGHLRFGPGRANLLAVRADNSLQPASRWYAGAGVYRHVRLVVTDPVHLGHWATFVTTPSVTTTRAIVHIQSAVVNESSTPRTVALQISLLSPDGRPAGTMLTPSRVVPAGGTGEFGADVPVPSPNLWDLAHPALYQAITRVQVAKATLDEETTPFGIRAFVFDPAQGFRLNGRSLKIKGVCLHGDAGGLGVAVPLGVWQRRLALLKQVGCNAVRTSHNPPAPEFLDLCDRMGFLVMDEGFDCWTVAKTPYDYHLYFKQWAGADTRDSVLRDRNHPSILLYSAGNEIHDTPNPAIAKPILAALLAVYHQYDPTRPVTQALFRPNVSHDYDDGLADMLDVVGTNYRDQELLAAHAARPSRKIIGTETSHDRTSWLALRDNAAYAGQFLWSGIDYLGEARAWPTVGAGAGLFDRTNAPRPLAFQRQSWWSDAPMVRIARRTAPTPVTPNDPGFAPLARRAQAVCDWTPRERAPHTENVEVYSNCAQAELFLNGRSLGSLPLPADASPRTWHVPFEQGTLRAVGRNGETVTATSELRTAGPAAKIVLAADQDTLTPSWDDVAYLRATITDAAGVPVPEASDLITFRVSGPAAIAAVDNGDLSSHEPFQAAQRHAYEGQCIAILKTTASAGQITLTASAPGLTAASVTLTARVKP